MTAAHEHLGGFRLVGGDALEGSGGQGSVCRAVCERADFPGLAVGTTVALKVMSESGRDAGRWQRLESMVATLVRLGAPNVVRYYGCFRERVGIVDLHVVVMELLEGETLKERLARSPGGVHAPGGVFIARAAGAGPGAAAAAGLVHRDVKPDNVFLCSDGAVKVIDFGIARREGSAATTNAAQLLGSFDYMAPERTDTAFRGDECSDVFSLGVVLHESLVGRLPYAVLSEHPELSFFERWGKGARESSLSVDQRIGRIVPGLDGVLAQALAVDRGERFACFAAFENALARLEPQVIRSDAESYRVTGLIGEGGFGEVLRARRVRDGATVALKHLKRMDGEAAKRFRGEARAMAALDDPAFVRFYEYFEVGGAVARQAYLSMACLDGMPGHSLRDVLTASKGGLPVDDVLEAFIRYAHGLAVLHAHGIVHRDIKPSNLYFPPGNAARAVIMDLGVALDWKTTLTQGMSPGTPDYMPPEVLTSASRGSSASDIYALGFCLYEALTGQPAFPRFRNGTSGSIEAFIIRARQMRAPRFDAPLVAQNPDLESLLRRMSDPDVTRRMANAAEVELELEDLLDSFRRGDLTVPASEDDAATPADGDGLTVDGATADSATAESLAVDENVKTGVPGERPQHPQAARGVGRGALVAAAVLALATAIVVVFWPKRDRSFEPPPLGSVVTQVERRVAVDTNALARAEERRLQEEAERKTAAEKNRRELAEIEEARRKLAAQLKAADEARRAADEARIQAEKNAAAATEKAARIQAEQNEAKRLAEKVEAERQAETERKRLEEEKRRLETERKRLKDAEEQARRRADYELQMAISGAQTSAVAIVRHYLDVKAKTVDVDVERKCWIERWGKVSNSPAYAAEYARALKLVDEARARRIVRDAQTTPNPTPPAVKPAPSSAAEPLPKELASKIADAELCLDDGDELGALRLYAEVAAIGRTLPKDVRTSAESAFEAYRLKNLEAQEIARTRTNSNYNEGKLKNELREARTHLKSILGTEKGN